MSRSSTDPTKAGFYNVGPDECDCVTTGELVQLFGKYYGPDFKAEIGDADPNAPHEANFLKLDTSLIKQKLGYRPTWHIEEAVEKTVEWTKEWMDDSSKRSICQIMEEQIADFQQQNKQKDDS